MDQYVCIDLGLVNKFDYYTGIVFRGYATGVGFPICGGGRYDHLLEQFGTSLPSTGVTLWIDRIHSALDRNGVFFEESPVDCVLCYEEPYRKNAIALAEILRRQHLRIDLYHGTDNPEDYAESCGCGGIMKVLSEDCIEVSNLIDGTSSRVRLQDLIKEAPEA